MSELKDREERFVEDQRRIALMSNSDVLQFANPQAPSYLVIRNAKGEDVVKVNFDGTLEFGENYEPDEAARCFWEAISLWAGNRDALLAEAAEVLRGVTEMDPTLEEFGAMNCLCCEEADGHAKDCPWVRAKALLEKL